MTKRVLALLILGFAAGSSAETLTFPVFSIDVATDWKHRVEERTSGSDERGDARTTERARWSSQLIIISRSDGVGVLTLQSWGAPADVSNDALRNLTNVEPTKLEWLEWGDLSGYQYSYTERGSFYKQWWLTNEPTARTILFVEYECDADAQEIEIEPIDEMVNSIRMNRS
jgi:hypothetical protein